MSTHETDHPYFQPLADPRLERLAAHLYRRWQEHEAEVAQWTQRAPLPREGVEPDSQRGYRALAVAAAEFEEKAVTEAKQ